MAKFPKKVKRFCPHCKKKTEQKVKLVGTGFQRGTLTRGSKSRAKLRGLGRGIGNKGKWGSRPAMSKFKRKSKTTKKTNIMYTCLECNKSKYRQGRRNKRTGKQIQE
jgi:ribosomal protein L44E